MASEPTVVPAAHYRVKPSVYRQSLAIIGGIWNHETASLEWFPFEQPAVRYVRERLLDRRRVKRMTQRAISAT